MASAKAVIEIKQFTHGAQGELITLGTHQVHVRRMRVPSQFMCATTLHFHPCEVCRFGGALHVINTRAGQEPHIALASEFKLPRSFQRARHRAKKL